MLDQNVSKAEEAIARHNTLRSQMTPHFLFNCLNALTNLIYEDQDKATKLTHLPFVELSSAFWQKGLASDRCTNTYSILSDCNLGYNRLP